MPELKISISTSRPDASPSAKRKRFRFKLTPPAYGSNVWRLYHRDGWGRYHVAMSPHHGDSFKPADQRNADWDDAEARLWAMREAQAYVDAECHPVHEFKLYGEK